MLIPDREFARLRLVGEMRPSTVVNRVRNVFCNAITRAHLCPATCDACVAHFQAGLDEIDTKRAKDPVAIFVNFLVGLRDMLIENGEIPSRLGAE